jgi:tetratricopeptide (TPR) repeat protein
MGVARHCGRLSAPNHDPGACLENILVSDTLRIDWIGAAQPPDIVFITFTELFNRRLDGPGFGGEFFLKHGFDVVAVKTIRDDWYASAPPDLFDRVNVFLESHPRNYRRRATYGSSMGGYAALRFAKAARADAAIALSPQFDISQSWDRRWAKWRSDARPFAPLSSDSLSPTCVYHLAHDPHDSDNIHVKEYEKLIPPPSLRIVKIPYAGHPVGPMLNNAGKLKEFVFAAAMGTACPARINLPPATREAFPKFYLNMASRVSSKGKKRLAQGILARGLRSEPLNGEFRIFNAWLHHALGDLDGAIENAAIASAVHPEHVPMLTNLAQFLSEKGMTEAAIVHLDRIMTLLPAPSAELLAFRDRLVRRRGGPAAAETRAPAPGPAKDRPAQVTRCGNDTLVVFRDA